ncbi:MAG: MFS transporter [Armatimonadota bacterium]
MIFKKFVPSEALDAYMKDSTAAMLGAVMTGLTVPFVPVVARLVLHASPVQLSIITMAPVMGYILAIFAALSIEGRRKKPVVVWSNVLASSLLLLMIFARTSVIYVTIVAAFWLIMTLCGPAYSAVMNEIYPTHCRAKVIGYVRTGQVIVGLIVTALAGPILNNHSIFRTVFAIAGLFGMAAGICFSFIKSEDKSGDRSVPIWTFIHNAVSALKDNPGYGWFCLGIFISGGANLLALPIFVLYQVDKLHVDMVWSGWYTIISQLAAIFAYAYWGHFIDRKTPTLATAILASIYALIPLGYCLATHAWMLIPVFVISGIANAGFELAYLSGVLAYAPTDRVTSYQAVFLTLMGLRGITCPFIGAYLYQHNIMSMHGIFMLSSILMFASVFVQLYGHRKYPTHSRYMA